jgi:hypothetical protein
MGCSAGIIAIDLAKHLLQVPSGCCYILYIDLVLCLLAKRERNEND